MIADRPSPSPPPGGAAPAQEPQYRDGRIPVGIWIVWAVFAVWAAWYSAKYAWPDFVAWLDEVGAR